MVKINCIKCGGLYFFPPLEKLYRAKTNGNTGPNFQNLVSNCVLFVTLFLWEYWVHSETQTNYWHFRAECKVNFVSIIKCEI